MTETLSPTLPPDLERTVHRLLKMASDRGLTLATAESCTGGLFASLLTDVDGYGHAFDRGFVVYTDAAKTDLLGVASDLLERCSAVSEPVARAMAAGALERSEADLALAVTGFAGRAGPHDEPGLVFLGVTTRDGHSRIVERHFGDVGRGAVRIACLRVGFELLEAALNEGSQDIQK